MQQSANRHQLTRVNVGPGNQPRQQGASCGVRPSRHASQRCFGVSVSGVGVSVSDGVMSWVVSLGFRQGRAIVTGAPGQDLKGGDLQAEAGRHMRL